MTTDAHRRTTRRRARPLTLLCLLTAVGLLFGVSRPSFGQIQIGTVKVTVADPAAALVTGASVTLENRVSGFRQAAVTGEHGAHTFNNVPFDSYSLRIEAPNFRPAARTIEVRSNLPLNIDVQLTLAGAREDIIVEAEPGLIARDSSSTQTNADESFIRHSPGLRRDVQQVIATMPGWTTENNGLLHVRGVDDGILYVLDGVPMADRLDLAMGNGLDTDTVGSMNVLTGNLPAEFGGRSGAVVTIQPKSGIGKPMAGTFEIGGGGFAAREIRGGLGGGGPTFGLYGATSASVTRRFLDPVDPRNLNNRGGAVSFFARADWHPGPRDILIIDASANGSGFRVPNRLEQDVAGQRQRQRLRNDSQSMSWQRTWSPATVSNVALFRRFSEARLFGTEFDTPLFAAQDRRHTRAGLLASVTHLYRGHTFKAGVEAARVAPSEFFTFAVTDSKAAEEAGFSKAALAFNRARPFVFADRKTRGQASSYFQDVFSPLKNLTVSAGLRYDHSDLLVSDQQLSPRIGAVYYFPRTRTALRASFNRLFMPPQVENLLLSDSPQARALSPFEGGGARVRPERISAYEAGIAQDIRGWAKLDVAFWRRSFRNYDDPNVFFSTLIVFPNSVASGYARGVDVRLDVPERRGWSGYFSYTNQRILQTGPINGGLFLTDEAIEIGPGTRFIPDHDERNAGSLGIMYRHQRSGLWAGVSGRHESGVPLEVDSDRLAELRFAPGADLVDFRRQRVKPRTLLGASAGVDLLRNERVAISAQLDVQNLFNKRFAYNFGNPFEGTHFGYPRLWSARIRLTFR